MASRLIDLKDVLIMFLWLISLIGCSSPTSVMLAEEGAFRFELRVKEDDLDYQTKEGYPANVTFLIEIEPIQEKDLVSLLISMDYQEEEVINYLSYQMKDALIVTTDEKQIKCQLFHFERSYQLKKGRTFLASFDLSSIKHDSNPNLEIRSKLFSEQPIQFDLTHFELYRR